MVRYRNVYIIETRRDKSPTTLVKEVGELTGQKNNDVNDDLNRHVYGVFQDNTEEGNRVC